MSTNLQRAILQGQGREPADLVLKGGRFLDLVSGDLVLSDIAITGDRISGTFGEYAGRREIDITGKTVVPGFIDTHLHIESSLVTPLEFDRCVLRHGVTTAICDPHEIANVLGAEGIRFFLESAMATVMDLRVQLSSCVPATHLETSGAALAASDLAPFMDHPKVIGLAEFMNFPGVLGLDPGALEKIALFAGRHIDGHAPLLRGMALNGYLAAGIRTDHETTSAAEALEKLSKGMHILIREGSVSKDLHALIPIMTERNSAFIALCTDDRNPLDIAEEGHLDFMIRTAIAEAVDPLTAYRAASISAARAFRLHDRGLVAPGWRADLAVLDDFEACRVAQVISAGRLVTDALFDARPAVRPVGYGSVKASAVTPEDFRITGDGKAFPVIGVLPGKIITEHLKMDLPARDGLVQCDAAQDAIKVAVVERHGINGNIGRGFVNGFGLRHGAIGSTVGHDSHNICVVGVADADMAFAVNHLREMGGGFVVVRDGRVLAELSLPIAGLMSDERFETVRDGLIPLREAARSLGTVLQEPFLHVAFLPLPVIPHLKISDRGLVDVDSFCLL
ncbi:adenine deaminase [Aestuariivirga sp.]|jgi:adenine deaminase|uniref:adenine deaminase n=1 Tax=Aestuariivirga sp. TaxID=2650926 RepID=UPI00378320E0